MSTFSPSSSVLVSSTVTSFPIFFKSSIFSITLFLVAVIISSAVPNGLFVCSFISFSFRYSIIWTLLFSNCACFAFLNIPVFVIDCIVIPESISNTIIVITKATNVIPFCFSISFFCKYIVLILLLFIFIKLLHYLMFFIFYYVFFLI